MKRILAVALLGALVAGSAFAQTAGTNTQARNGYYFNATTGEKTDADGNAYTSEASKDRDYSSVTNVLTASTLAPGASAISGNSVEVGKYTSLMVMVSWNTTAAADSDSVAFGISFIGKVSSGTNDGYDFLLSSTDTARFARVDTTIVNLFSMYKPHTNYIISWMKTRYLGGSGYMFSLKPAATGAAYGGAAIKPFLVPQARVIWADGHNGVCFNLVNNGQPVKLSHLMVHIQNLAGATTYSNIRVDVWPKVN